MNEYVLLLIQAKYILYPFDKMSNEMVVYCDLITIILRIRQDDMRQKKEKRDAINHDISCSVSNHVQPQSFGFR